MKDRSIRIATRRVVLAAVAAALLPATAVGGRTTVEVGEGVPDAHEQRVLAGVLLEAVEGQVPPEQRGAWRELLLERIETADPLNLRIAAESPDPGQALAALAGAVDPRDPLSPLEIGSPTRDLSFTPLEPCRLVDTRITGAAIAADTSRVFAGFSILGFQGQGGANWNCGIPSGVVALSLNVTVVEPGGRGFATAYPAHVVRPTASTVNYEPGVNLSNESIVRLSPAWSSASTADGPSTWWSTSPATSSCPRRRPCSASPRPPTSRSPPAPPASWMPPVPGGTR